MSEVRLLKGAIAGVDTHIDRLNEEIRRLQKWREEMLTEWWAETHQLKVGDRVQLLVERTGHRWYSGEEEYHCCDFAAGTGFKIYEFTDCNTFELADEEFYMSVYDVRADQVVKVS